MSGAPTEDGDRNVEAVRDKLLERARVGLAKYGVTTCRNPLDQRRWLQHLQEELMDAAVYVEQLMREATPLSVPLKDACQVLAAHRAECDEVKQQLDSLLAVFTAHGMPDDAEPGEWVQSKLQSLQRYKERYGILGLSDEQHLAIERGINEVLRLDNAEFKEQLTAAQAKLAGLAGEIRGLKNGGVSVTERYWYGAGLSAAAELVAAAVGECPKCAGEGERYDGKVCSECDGTGEKPAAAEKPGRCEENSNVKGEA